MDSIVDKPLPEVALNDIPRSTVVAKGGKSSVYACCIEGKLYCLKEVGEEGGVGLLAEVEALKKVGKVEGVPEAVKTFREGEKLYLLKRFASGCTVEKLFYAAPKLPEPLVLHIVQSLGVILDAVHTKGLVYRDLKADNVVISKEGEVSLIDMGFCTPVQGEAVPCGAYHARAPETFSNGPDGPAIDYWCLGILAYELSTGKPPSGFLTTEAEALAFLSRPLPLTPLPPLTRPIVSLLLQRDPASRPTWSALRSHPSFTQPPSRRTSAIEPFVEEIEMQTLGLDEGTAPPTKW